MKVLMIKQFLKGGPTIKFMFTEIVNTLGQRRRVQKKHMGVNGMTEGTGSNYSGAYDYEEALTRNFNRGNGENELSYFKIKFIYEEDT